MGGNAFKQLLPDAPFPRMSPDVYEALKTHLLCIIREFYTHVAVPAEYPGKKDHGDLDVVVSGPRDGLQHQELKTALRARCSIPMEGNRASNFAIPFSAFIPPNKGSSDEEAFLQVDVNVCEDRAQWERAVFYQSYGDLGFFIGLLAQTAGLSFGTYGLKVRFRPPPIHSPQTHPCTIQLIKPLPTSPPQTYRLSDSYHDILAFFGIPFDHYATGFTTQEELFAWVTLSPAAYVLAARYRSPDYVPPFQGSDARPMRRAFFTYLQTCDLPPLVQSPTAELLASTDKTQRDAKVAAALEYFGKAEDHARILLVARIQRRAKEILNGKNVEAWTSAKGMPIKLIMDKVKERLSLTARQLVEEVPRWQCALLDMSDDEVRIYVVEVKEEMQAAGKLQFDWRGAQAAKQERKKMQQLEGARTLENITGTPYTTPEA